MSQIEQFKHESKQNMSALCGGLNVQYLLLEKLENNTHALGAIGNRLKALNACFQGIDPIQRENLAYHKFAGAVAGDAQDRARDLISSKIATLAAGFEPVENTKLHHVISCRTLYPLLAIKPKKPGTWGRRRH